MSSDDYVELTVKVHHQTDNAVLVSDNDNDEDGVWIPYSQIEDGRAGVNPLMKGIATIYVKEWIAKEKGLI